ncbi:MAG: hypothetical protein ACHQUC_06925 [Chlamydiales bacterium]
MEVLADLFDLQYLMVHEVNSSKHIVLVKNTKKGTSAFLVLESGEVIDSDFDSESLSKVKDQLRYSKKDFLDYWNSLK